MDTATPDVVEGARLRSGVERQTRRPHVPRGGLALQKAKRPVRTVAVKNTIAALVGSTPDAKPATAKATPP